MNRTAKLLFLAVICCSALSVIANAQQGQQSTPNGTSLKDGDNGEVITDQEVISSSDLQFRVPSGRFIKSIGWKFTTSGGKRQTHEGFIVLDDGSLYFAETDFIVGITGLLTGVGAYFEHRGQIDLSPDSLRHFIGDDLYSFAYSNVYVSRGTDALTWNVDTAGLGGATPAELALDSAQNVYLATNRGLYKQTPAGSTWQLLSNMTKALSSVFIDRTSHWLYVSTQSNGIYASSDLGTTWQVDSAGTGTTTISSFSDDALGNIYATIAPSFGPFGNTGSQLFRSSEGTTTWARVDAGLAAKSASGSISINSVWGDSTLSAATDLGLYTSTDQGNTWSDANAGIEAENAYGLVRLPSGRLVATTDLGVFTEEAGSNSWSKEYPVTGYQRFDLPPIAIQRDGQGYLYTGNSDHIYKSTDDGNTWTQYGPGISFTSGLPSVPGLFYTDETGLLHYAPPTVYSSFSPTQLFVQSGSNWIGDQSGLTVSVGDQFYGYASNRQGTLFLYRSSASNVQVARRPIGGGTWVADTTGLSGRALMSMVRGRDGSMYGGAQGGGIYHRIDSTWSKISAPAPISSNDVAQISIDSTGAIFVGLQVPGSFPVTGRGVYFLKNGGTSWTYAGLDSVLIRGLVSSGDSTYALTVGRGVSLLRSSSFAFLQFNSPAFSFDTVNVGQSKDIQVAFTNSGTDTLKVSAVTSRGGPFSPQQATTTVNPQQSSGITVRFTPSSTGAFAATIKIASNSSHSPDSAVVFGIAVSATSVRSSDILPRKYVLDQNYPNPFNPTTTIRFSIVKLSIVDLKIYDLLGREVETLVDGPMEAGTHEVTFDATRFASGIYFYRLKAGSFTATKKLVLIK